MKNKFILLLFLSIPSLFLGQVYEIGLSLGGSNYVGDIGRTNYIYPNHFSGALLAKYNYNPRIVLRGSFSYIPITGNDAEASTDFRQKRGLKFSNTILELAVGMEFNFYEYDLSSKEKSWTPYILIEVAALNYTYFAGQNILEERNAKKETSLALPIGLGFKSKLYGKFAFALETKFIYSFKDNLDYISEDNLRYSAEGNSNDWYMFTGVSLIYTFGRPACYTPGL
jgi:hypothetical protein